jgi:NodT family efflux transporter outer membrane factor (OMF) lipoprotein
VTLRPLRPLLLAAALAPALAGCMVGPNYSRPAPLPASTAQGGSAPPQFKELAGWTPARPLDAVPKGDWWRVFGDPVLSGLEARVQVTNQNVVAAEAAYRQARAITAQARSQLFPQIGANLSFQRTGTLGSNGANIATTGAGGTIVTSGGSGDSNRFNGSLDASWALDVWGRIRRTIEADRDNAQASAADLANATLSAQAELASDYFSLRFYDEQKRLLAQTVDAYGRTLKVIQNQYNAGTVARADVITAQTQLLGTQASLVDVDRQRAALEHAIAVLVGDAPANLSLDTGALPPDAPTAPAGLPSQLLERRPDIAAAERRVASANAEIGVAISAYFPTLNLTGSLGASADDFGRLFRAENSIWSLGASTAETLLDFGSRRAQVQQARAAYDQQVAAYRQTVLTALQGVEDNLSSLRTLEREQAVREQQVAAARRAEELAVNQYRQGLVDITTVVTAQANSLSAQQNALSTRNDRLAASVALIQALGGGWDATDLPKG